MPDKYKNIDDYINSFPFKIKNLLTTLRKTIRNTAPEANEKFSYGVPAFTQNGDLVLYAAFRDHIGFYPTPSVIIKFKKELSKYDTAKGTIRFPLDKPLPIKLIAEIVKYKVNENQKNSGII